MSWSSQITIIFITHSKIRSAVLTSEGKIVKELKTYDWDKDSLPAILQDIYSRGPARARVVFSEDFSYVASLGINEKNRNIVLEKAQETIPDQLDNNWDFKNEENDNSSSQVAAIEHAGFNDFITAFNAAGLEVEAIEPQSITMARLLPQSGFFLFIAKSESVLLGAVKDSAIVATYVAKEEDLALALEKFLVYVKNKCNGLPEKVFIDRAIEIQLEIFSQNNLATGVMDFNPLVGMALKKDITGEDAKILNIDPRRIVKIVKKKTEKSCGMTLSEKILAVVFFLVIIGLLVFWKMR